MKKILVTAGSTFMPIDRVRGMTNIFRGGTGERIMHVAACMGHSVKLLTSDPESARRAGAYRHVRGERFRTFDDLAELMEREIRTGGYDAVIHSAAVSDYRVSAIRVGDKILDPAETGSKIGSGHERLTLELVPTEKLVDKIRSPWGFTGVLVKFKLQVDMPDSVLIEIAHQSMLASQADFVVANCLEWERERAYILSARGDCIHAQREHLAAELLRMAL